MTSKTGISIEISTQPDCDRLAEIHAACFPNAWDAQAFAEMLGINGTFACQAEGGFGLMRGLGEAAELLTLAVVKEARRRGIAKALLACMLDLAKKQGALTFLLEVGEDNAAARSLYETAGFQTIARRTDYYRYPDGSHVSALVMRIVP